MKNIFYTCLVFAVLVLGPPSLLAQDYPFLLTDGSFTANEHPTSIASAGKFVATAGIYEDTYKVFDRSNEEYYEVPCSVCAPYTSAFATLRDEGTGNVWTAIIFLGDLTSMINNRVDMQSVPQVDVTVDGDVYVSFTYMGDVYVEDAHRQLIPVAPAGGNWDMAIFKFDINGNYLWHVTEGSPSNDFITDIDYNEDNNLLGVAGYVEGTGPDLILNQGALLTYPVLAGSVPGTVGANYGNAFAALYEDFGSTAVALWARDAKVFSYSSDIAVANSGQVYLSGMVRGASASSSAWLAGASYGGGYRCGRFDLQYFVASFEASSSPLWAELYGSPNDEMQIAPLLRASSLAIHPEHNEVYHAIVSGGGRCRYFSKFGTYVNRIDAGSGAILQSIPMGMEKVAYDDLATYSPKGSPLYNPNIDVIRTSSPSTKAVEITGNFLLTDGSAPSSIIAGFESLEIGGVNLDFTATSASAVGHPEATGFYAAVVDFSGAPAVFNANINSTYVPAFPTDIYRKIPVYGLAYDESFDFYYTVLGFESGTFEVGPIGLGGPTIPYDNLSPVQQFDGLVLRYTIGGGGYFRPVADHSTDPNQMTTLSGADQWMVQPNPAPAGATITLQGITQELDQVQLIDLTGRTVQTWLQPNNNGNETMLALKGELVPGTYFIRTLQEGAQKTTPVVIR